jgi:hypothetical protein
MIGKRPHQLSALPSRTQLWRPTTPTRIIFPAFKWIASPAMKQSMLPDFV